jgi:NAD(P)-dependent dehydrogenase (short-subunit alcohol dehydrogenase family)
MSSGWKAASKVSAAELRTDSDTNYIATALTTLAFLPLLQASPATTAPAKVIHISSLLASASLLPTLGKWASVAACYSASKVAAVMWLRKLASEIADGSAGVGREGGWVVGMVRPPGPGREADPTG